jgi:hypothetical protein
MGMGYDKSKFVFSETFNNASGKTSGSGFIGVMMGMAAIIGFVTALLGWWMGKPEVIELFDKILQLGLLSAALLGVRKFTGTLANAKGKTGIEGDSGQQEQPGEEEKPREERG